MVHLAHRVRSHEEEGAFHHRLLTAIYWQSGIVVLFSAIDHLLLSIPSKVLPYHMIFMSPKLPPPPGVLLLPSLSLLS